MEEMISQYMLRMGKFEFFLVSMDIELAHVSGANQAVMGVNWTRLAQRVENRYPFAQFDFDHPPIRMFKETAPQFLVKSDRGGLKWDSDDAAIDSWDRLFSRSFAQLRNNIAHGNKALMPAAFTHERTEQFIAAGHALMDFVGQAIFHYGDWDGPIAFR